MKSNMHRFRMSAIAPVVRRPVLVTPGAMYREIGIRSFGKGVFHKAPTSGLQIGSKRVFEIHPGDLLFNIVFAWEGAVAVASEAEQGMIGSHRFLTCRVDRQFVEPRYLYWWFLRDEGRAQLLRASPGGAGRNRTLGVDKLQAIEVPLPSPQEQRESLAWIDQLSVRLKEARERAARVADDSETLLIAMAHRADLDNDSKQRAGWRRFRLGDVLRFKIDICKVDPTASYPNVGMYSFGRGLFHKPPIEGLSTSASTLQRVTAGQFIYSRLFAFEGAYGLVTDEFDGKYVSSEYPTFDCDTTHLLPEFLVAYFKSKHVWRTVAAGSKGLGNRRQRVQPEKILSHELWLPPFSYQERVAQVSRKIAETSKLRTGADAATEQVFVKAVEGEFARLAAMSVGIA
jgi:type I restriction enzyme S subunit